MKSFCNCSSKGAYLESEAATALEALRTALEAARVATEERHWFPIRDIGLAQAVADRVQSEVDTLTELRRVVALNPAEHEADYRSALAMASVLSMILGCNDTFQLCLTSRRPRSCQWVMIW